MCPTRISVLAHKIGKSAGGANGGRQCYRYIIVAVFGKMSSDFAYEFYVYFLIKKLLIGMRYFNAEKYAIFHPVETQHILHRMFAP